MPESKKKRAENNSNSIDRRGEKSNEMNKYENERAALCLSVRHSSVGAATVRACEQNIYFASAICLRHNNYIIFVICTASSAER